MSRLFGVTTDYLLKDDAAEPEYTEDDTSPLPRVTLAQANDYLAKAKANAPRLALATALSSFITTVLLIIQLQRKMGHMGYRYLAGTYLKMIIAAGAMTAATLPFYHWFSTKTTSLLVSLLAAIVVAMIVYFIACLLLRVKELGHVVVAIAERFHRRRPA